MVLFAGQTPFEAGEQLGRALAPLILIAVVVIVAIWLYRRRRGTH
jgi:hypothetical protein